MSDADAPPAYATPFHTPVLCHAVLEALVTQNAGLYVDATLGGGGHSAALLGRLAPGGSVVGLDQDEAALAEASARLSGDPRFRALYGNFGRLETLLSAEGIAHVDGLLLDLGVSSHQLDMPQRGFSHRLDAPLDMRMDMHMARTAGDIVNTFTEAELRQVLYTWGEESRARSICRAIVRARPLATTTELASVVRGAVPRRHEAKTLARVFQAIRIAVNGELASLESVLEAAARVVRPGGRMVVISYHSLEDRRVKRMFRHGNLQGEPVRDVYGTPINPWRALTRKPVSPSDAEIAANPRARSARLRAAERTSASNQHANYAHAINTTP